MTTSVKHNSITGDTPGVASGALGNRFFTLSIDLMCIADFDGYFKELNPAFEKTLGWSTAELLERPFIEFVHPHDKAATIAEAEKLAQGAPTNSFENRYLCKDGSYKWLMWNTTPAPEEGLLYAVAHDITERKRIEQALYESDRRFELAARATSDVIWDWNITTNSIWFNDSFQALFGYQSAQVQDHIDWWSSLLHPDDVAGIRSSLQAALGSGGAFWASEDRLRRADDSYADVLNRSFIEYDDAGEPVRMIGSIMDVSEHRRMEQTLRASAAKLERSNRDLEEFASIASHDLQEPLRKIQAFGDRWRTVSNGALDEEGYDCVARMLDAATRMRSLIDELLTYSRLATKVQPFMEVDLTKVALDVLSDLEVQVTKTGGRVEVGPLPVIEADPMQMRRLLQNLISNALKFHRDDAPPLVIVRGEIATYEPGLATAGTPVEQLCRIVVEDNGIGFDEKYAERIFAPFKRLHTRSQYEGTGMGLAACRKIVENHGGTITAESTPGQGAAFIVCLPATQPEGANLR
ncbi:MAG TPA: PAS domain-containing protein [Chloroflexia bacterium]|nr:PAS domain-containing protein [Chloroflexia bacterium]